MRARHLSPRTEQAHLGWIVRYIRYHGTRHPAELGERPARVLRPSSPTRLPTVLSRGDVRALLAQMQGTHRLIALLLYGAGLRLMECLTLG